MRTSSKQVKAFRRIDAIYTGGGDGLCCLAVKHGFGYGLNSGHATTCLYATQTTTRRMPEHRVMFVDNDFKHYDHQQHLAVVKQFRPKYATVQDVMLKSDLDRILDYAEELTQFAENVMLIPKADCIDQIPEKFMLGYAVPTSYGGTTLPYSAFGNRRVHLLGGAWQQQLHLIKSSGMNIVSLDFNHCHKMAKHGIFNDGNGYEYKLHDCMPHFSDNPYYTCLCLSLAAIRYKLNRINVDEFRSAS